MKTVGVGRSFLLCLAALAGPNALSAFPLFGQSGVGVVNGSLFVPGEIMAGKCTTMITPRYPRGISAAKPEASLVILRVIVNRAGKASPLYVVSGPSAFGNEAMSAVRTWKYRPYQRNGNAVDVVTDVRIVFIPGQAEGFVTHPNR